MVLTKKEYAEIKMKVEPIFEGITARYDENKYPPLDYEKFKEVFSKRNLVNEEIENALKWKWGHTGKKNYPSAHKLLIKEVTASWCHFVGEVNLSSPQSTFDWWCRQLNRPTTYISAAFLTHLIHSEDGLPIIDQHNFRGMNNLIKAVRPGYQYKKKPSNWADISLLQDFIAGLSECLDQKPAKMDRFLMMYGRHLAPR